MSEKHDLDAPGTDGEQEGRHTAGAFDIRNFIGALLGLYGLILLAMGIFGDQSLDKTGGVNANLYAGIALVVVSAFFIGWARIKPIVVPEHVEPAGDDPTRPAPKRRSTGH
ncbi:hypothetical protein GCM10009721_00350 [Terrabacter tumescens]|uniref:Uncharacterized protein n=1 Tax=Terrabacter tumescens TaxID=60443 RepID=A0ABQ2HFK1_9MICO|nr:hypothetical protein [Terrabacter tumescens]GGM79837.1 hypothetical protein GCM10009721_00350 [Terrabacter tumescens]